MAQQNPATLKGLLKIPGLGETRAAQYGEAVLALIKAGNEAAEPDWGHYHQFTIYDPKVRVISAAPFCERVMHHAIMNVLEPVFENHLMFHSYACRKGKGIQAAILYAFSCSKAHHWFLKLDIRKFFDSISHQILKNQLRRLFKDTRLLFLLDSLIDSYQTSPATGLPIGNLTSQFFANHYLFAMDHYILEKLRPRAYVRYMDDFVLWQAYGRSSFFGLSFKTARYLSAPKNKKAHEKKGISFKL